MCSTSCDRVGTELKLSRHNSRREGEGRPAADSGIPVPGSVKNVTLRGGVGRPALSPDGCCIVSVVIPVTGRCQDLSAVGSGGKLEI